MNTYVRYDFEDHYDRGKRIKLIRITYDDHLPKYVKKDVDGKNYWMSSRECFPGYHKYSKWKLIDDNSQTFHTGKQKIGKYDYEFTPQFYLENGELIEKYKQIRR